jgi:aminoglycoside phosphotransferase (APT) family kinase protein
VSESIGDEDAIPGVDFERLAEWMDAQELPPGPITNAETLAGGTQNILIRFQRGGRDYVLRRPPLHKRKNSDETMRREARVLGAIAHSDVPHPPLIAACPDTDVIGAAFYLMEPVEGFNPTRGLPAYHAGDAKLRHRMGLSMAAGIAALARIDYLAVGLDGFGKPDGYLERQVARWRRQLDGYSELEGYAGPEIPGVDDVARWLDDNRPPGGKPGILHGDFHLANVMFRNDSPDLAAIVDWELSSVGDPLLDLGWLLATWPAPEGGPAGSIGVQPWDGFPTASELVERYREGTERDLSRIEWYAVLACYKLGIILEGTHARACAGKAPKLIGDLLHSMALSFIERALNWLS